MYSLGDLQLTTISGGLFRLDGGAMFGLVPKPLWSRICQPDEANRIQLTTNCVLVRAAGRLVLIETGCGSKLTDKERQIYVSEAGDPLIASLSATGIDAADIDLVILTHLHFDHAGGATQRKADGTLQPTFPNAEYAVQRWEWEVARADFPELKGSYPRDNLTPLADAGQLRLLDGDVEIVPGIRALVTGGHTLAHQAIVLESQGRTAIYLGDLCPTSLHIPPLWCMGYDVDLLHLRRVKRNLLGKIADGGWLALWGHDPKFAAAKLTRDPQRDFALGETITAL